MKSNLSLNGERSHQVVTQDCFWMLLLDSFLIPTLHEHSQDPSAGVSCIFSGFLNISFLGHSLLFGRDQVNLPSFQEGLATWHLTTLPALPPLSSNIASWGHVGEKEFPNLKLTRKQIDMRVWRAERNYIRASSSLPYCSAEQINLSFIYFIFWFYCISIYFFKCNFTK